MSLPSLILSVTTGHCWLPGRAQTLLPPICFAALRAANGKVSDPGGAAELLGLKPTTLASRIKSLGILPPQARLTESASTSRSGAVPTCQRKPGPDRPVPHHPER